jgi:hypothetical protein
VKVFRKNQRIRLSFAAGRELLVLQRLRARAKVVMTAVAVRDVMGPI